jgi:flagellar biosynthesis GTPase FlhF
MKTQNFFFLFSTSMQEKKEEKISEKQQKHQVKAKLYSNSKLRSLRSVCLSVCLSLSTHSFHLLVNPSLVGKSTTTARAAKELNPLSFAAS